MYPIVRPLATLAAIAFVAAALLAGVNEATHDKIRKEEQRRALAVLTGLLPESAYDNDLIGDRFTAGIPGLAGPATVYRARKNGEPAALLVDATTPEGYSGPIRLLVGLEPDGGVIGVRALEHRETPGLGDRVERRRSDWIEQFAGTSLGDPPAGRWAPDRRGGAFDTMTSATITSAAVIEAVRHVLEWHAANRENAFSTDAESG